MSHFLLGDAEPIGSLAGRVSSLPFGRSLVLARRLPSRPLPSRARASPAAEAMTSVAAPADHDQAPAAAAAELTRIALFGGPFRSLLDGSSGPSERTCHLPSRLRQQGSTSDSSSPWRFLERSEPRSATTWRAPAFRFSEGRSGPYSAATPRPRNARPLAQGEPPAFLSRLALAHGFRRIQVSADRTRAPAGKQAAHCSSVSPRKSARRSS